MREYGYSTKVAYVHEVIYHFDHQDVLPKMIWRNIHLL